MESKSGSMEFELVQVGFPGRVEVVDGISAVPNPILPTATLLCGLPPVLPSVEDEIENLLKHPENLPIHDYKRQQRSLPRKPVPEHLYHLDTTPVQMELVVDRNPTTGELLGFREELISGIGDTNKNSTSLSRAPGSLSEGIRGSTTNFPFWPGGLEEPDLPALQGAKPGDEVDLENNLSDTAPGMRKGMTFPQKRLSVILDNAARQATVNLADILAAGDEIDLGEDGDEVEAATGDGADQCPKIPTQSAAARENIDDIIKLDSRLELDTGGSSSRGDGEEWAVVLDTTRPVDDFHRRIPSPAYSWPFELDVFQKQAVLHLEMHDNVFVAAHTSAGKTVAAEYAIALSMKHMTRSIYTSPIKALSNQKFRDFKQTFGDVGLITGDVQLKPEASCLIMTTEILRSMLYNGSDVIRDLEWVIFDEVHYINDAERGVVWEEVLIMLPQHVHIILLSATVPNSREFAAWVGRTKRKKVYVVSTTKRPVPLEHFLYTGNSAKTSNELFLLMDAQKKFLQTGYTKAIDAKKERSSKASQGYGAKGARTGGGPSQDKNVWLSVIEMLRKKDKLPVVAFTFSKKRIDDNANHLTSVDLTTQSEKSEIHIFFQRCVSRLKGTDKELPQVKRMCDILKRGIGIHHSGVLPILKEVVEMLFQRGLVKILFATETFAMGVNMPARTVVFDSIRKHDGTNFRDLLPGEYIQMAGRAGRRGLDTTGTVILLCKGDVPEMADLHKMMLGKPTLLQSQFRLTYSMILNLLRVEQLRIEDMMKRSFSEFHNQKDVSQHKATLEDVTKQLADLPLVYDYSGDMEAYYTACDEYHRLHGALHKIVMSHPAAMKALSPGRLVIIDTPGHRHSLGVILQAGLASSKERTFTALVTCEEGKVTKDGGAVSHDGRTEGPEPVKSTPLFRPEGPCAHTTVTLKTKDIKRICTKTIKVSADKIVEDIRKRQQPRFRKDPPGQSVSVATQELMRIVEANPTWLPGLDPIKDLHIRDVDMVEDFQRLQVLESSFDVFKCTEEPSFDENFAQLRSNKKLQEKYEHLRFLLSDQSLTLLPEYNQRIDVLRKLNYIDDSNTVQLKGRVACEISNHELIITELVFENVLTALHPTEIASLLSAVVCEVKKCSEPNLHPSLVEAKENFLKVAEKIGLLQKECGLLIPVDDYVQEFKFGLAEVVFEWARGMPFNDITDLTDIQEGIIVRCIQRLDEALRDVRNAARIIGDPVLYQKMEEASRMIKRDIVFAASLYTQ